MVEHVPRTWFVLAAALSGGLSSRASARLATMTDAGWLRLIALANEEMVSAELARVLLESDVRAMVPADVASYLQLLLAANAERNDQLSRDCRCIALAANGRRIVLLKGATWLFDPRAERRNTRMMRDIDVLVDRNDAPAVAAGLEALGYEFDKSFAEPTHFHLPPLVHLGRGSAVEIHLDLSHWPSLLPAREVLDQAIPVAPGLWCPTPAHRILHNVLHAQKENGDWWAGAIRLRDALDLARLVADQAEGGLDWPAFAGHVRAIGLDRVVSGALHAAHWALGAPLPPPFDASRAGWLHAARCIAQQRIPGAVRLEALGRLTRAFAWDRDAYGISTAQGGAAGIVLGRRLHRILRHVWRAGRV